MIWPGPAVDRPVAFQLELVLEGGALVLDEDLERLLLSPLCHLYFTGQDFGLLLLKLRVVDS